MVGEALEFKMKFSEKSWTIGKIVDLEYAFLQDKNVLRETILKKRDREIYLQHIPEEDPPSRGDIIALWLDEIKRRKGHPYRPSPISPDHAAMGNDFPIDDDPSDGWSEGDPSLTFPGKLYEETLALGGLIMVVAGLLAGFSLCLSFFTYTGHQPLNVSYFLAVILLPQLFLLILISGFFLSMKFKWIDGRYHQPYPIITKIMERLFLILLRPMGQNVSKKVSQESKTQMSAVLGIVQQGKAVYGLLFFWPLFKIVQLFGVAFNCAVLFFILFRVLFFDTAFGWQSTLQVGADAVNQVVTLMALPWSWIRPEGFAVPSFDHIVGSRIILKDGIFRLATEDLVSWWPFLCMSVVIYGMLPRLLLFGYGKLALSRELKKLSFDHADCTRLLRRMVTPHVGLEGQAVGEIREYNRHVTSPDTTIYENSGTRRDRDCYIKMETDEQLREKPMQTKKSSQIPPSGNALSPCIALVPDDLQGGVNADAFNQLMQALHGLFVIGIIPMEMDASQTVEAVKQMESAWQDDGGKQGVERAEDKAHYPLSFETPAIVLLLEAWQPPIKEILDFIKAMREKIGQRRALTVLLLGKPTPKTIFTPASKVDWDIWRLKLTALGDPWLSMEEIVELKAQ